MKMGFFCFISINYLWPISVFDQNTLRILCIIQQKIYDKEEEEEGMKKDNLYSVIEKKIIKFLLERFILRLTKNDDSYVIIIFKIK